MGAGNESELLGEPWPFREVSGDVLPRVHVQLTRDELAISFGSSETWLRAAWPP
jgi:hypothetical protein